MSDKNKNWILAIALAVAFIANSAFADVTLTDAELVKVEKHITGLNDRILELEKTVATLRKQIEESSKNKNSIVLDDILGNVDDKTPEIKELKPTKMVSTKVCHEEGTRYYDTVKTFTSYDSIDACIAAGGRLPKYLQAELNLENELANEVESGWEITTWTDDLTDKESIFAMSTTKVGYDDRALVVRCTGGAKLEVIVNWQDYIGSDSVPVKIRWGNESVIKAGFWSTSTDKTAVFAKKQNVEGYIKKLMKHDKFVVGLTPYNEGPQTTVFDITGKKALFKVVTACNVANRYR